MTMPRGKIEKEVPASAPAYVSTQPAFVDGVYYKPGERFSTDAPKAADWSEA